MSLTKDWDYGNDIKGTLGSTNVHGICMTTSCHWAKKSLKLGRKMTEPPGVDLNAAAAMHVVRTKEQRAVDATGGAFDARVETWHQVYFERLNIKGNLLAKGSGPSWDITSKLGVYVLTIYGQGGHTMAFARFTAESVFFDPNFGQFSCKASLLSSFKKDVKAKLQAPHYANLQGNWYVYKVTI
jgi:Yersinia/Haemophilus virulence surface antigen